MSTSIHIFISISLYDIFTSLSLSLYITTPRDHDGQPHGPGDGLRGADVGLAQGAGYMCICMYIYIYIYICSTNNNSTNNDNNNNNDNNDHHNNA